MEIKINNIKFEAQEGETVLDVCRRNGISIPTLCSLKDKREGVCRLCLVEWNGRLVTACNTGVVPEMEVVTENEKISRARKINLELLWADHAGKCINCKKNRSCELQNLAEKQRAENFHFVPRKEELTSREELDLLKDNRMRVVVDENNPAISRTTELCVECRHCINVCPTKEFSFNYRAGDVAVGTPFEEPLDCMFCGQCVKHCPTGAITDKNDLAQIIADLDDPQKMAIALWDPALQESMTDEQAEIDSTGKVAGVLKEIGFEAIFETSKGKEIFLKKTIETVKAKRKKNQLLGYCPAMKRYLQKYAQEYLDDWLEMESPDNQLADFIKQEYALKNKINPQNIVIVSISACVARKMDKGKHLDWVITLRELGRIMRQKKVNFSSIKSDFWGKDLGMCDNRTKKMDSAGGLAELVAEETDVDYLSFNGVAEIKKMLQDLRAGRVKTDIIEATICPRGCVGGGGQSLKMRN